MTLMIMGEAGNSEECISLGPWGGTRDGQPWACLPPANEDLTQITIRHGKVIDSVQFQTVNRDTGLLNDSHKFGGPGGDNETKVAIDNKGEQLKSIDMTVEEGYKKQTVITSITFHTNLSSYGPVGRNSGFTVSNQMEGGLILGLHGRAGTYLNAIGIYVVPKQRLSSSQPQEDNLILDQQRCGFMKTALARDIGPWGDISGGKRWDDGVFSRVQQVDVQYCRKSRRLIGIEFQYLMADGRLVSSPLHGGWAWGSQEVSYKWTDGEELVGIEGYVCKFTNDEDCSDELIRSISFYTNKAQYGPVGLEIGKHFMSSVAGGRIVGFWGASGAHLYAIGVHMSYS